METASSTLTPCLHYRQHVNPSLHSWNMTSENTNAPTPTASPPAKRVKLNETATKAQTTTSTMSAPPLMIKKLSEKARLPTRGSAFAAGYDIYASKVTVIPARGKALVDTDISMACPAGTCTSALDVTRHSFYLRRSVRCAHLLDRKLTSLSQTVALPPAPA